MPPAKTIVIDRSRPDDKLLMQAAMVLRDGGLAIIPTETVYGVAARRDHSQAVSRLIALKDRPDAKPFSLHIAEKEDFYCFVKEVTPLAHKLIQAFWPGPLTLIFTAKDGGTIGVRFPDDGIARSIIRSSCVPVICPSANLAGKPAPRTFAEALSDLKGSVDIAVDAGPTKVQRESTVVDVTGKQVMVLREGAVPAADIARVAQLKRVLFVCTGNSCRSVMAEGLLRKRLSDIGRTNVEVLSAGMMMTEGMPASIETQQLLRREGIDATRHRSRRLTRDLIDASDLILVMEDVHEQRVMQLAPQSGGRVFLLREFVSSGGRNLNVPDPVGRGMDVYEQTFAVIKEAVDKVSQIV